MSRMVVFLGPTLAVAEASLHTPANILPPARLGDVYDAVTRQGARAIGLVDGLFNSVPAVWHKEILFALSQGVRVFGAASMGALRAAELHTFGMEGVGAVFAAFAGGGLTDDDEVAVAHGAAESGFRPLSEALVNIRHGLEMAEGAGSISAATASRLLTHAKATFYADRSWPALFRAAPGLGVGEDELAGLRAFVGRVRPNRKRDDAIALLRAMTDAGGEAMPPHVPTFEFEATSFWESMVATTARAEATAPREEALALHALLSPGGEERGRGALLLALALAEAERRGLEVEGAAMSAAAERIRRALGLRDKLAMSTWLKEQGLDLAGSQALLRTEAIVELLGREYATAVRSLVTLELQRRGELGRVREELASAGESGWSETGLSREALLQWYETEVRWLGADLPTALRSLGLSTLDQLLAAIARVHAVRAKRGS
ncbi:TfuA-like protein [Nannocystis radixulma]|uniref:TfuA-like protein n=1 Tax=Nannocystis radixulma TaxID=2995305 RepID=A0ABT5BNT5_9BACT|nr:TfuA-like protein [Nannocystis radixulma]MDC0675235.1 TfuA-like protein [Nannocystis radixulma]